MPTESGGVTSCDMMESFDLSMVCYSYGDPHFTSFSGRKYSPMGQGEYVLAQGGGFSVHACTEISSP